MSTTVRRLLRKALTDEEGADEALDMESLRESHARDNRLLGKRLMRFLVWLIYDVGQVKVLSNNILGMQKGMGDQMLKDILQDADRQTRARFSRMDPKLSDFIDAVVDQWLASDGTEGRQERGA